MAKTSYYDKLRDPRWQKKRLEIMQRDGFKCIICTQCNCLDAGTKTLNVHHQYYISGRSPWEYPNWSLQTLCEECHSIHKEPVIIQSEKWFELLAGAFVDGTEDPEWLRDLITMMSLAKNYGIQKRDIASSILHSVRSLLDFHKVPVLRSIGRPEHMNLD